jgi:predicted RNA-binding protein (virulence factor B family)
LKKLKRTGTLDFSDKSSPEDIMDEFQMSKKAFKKALGVLYKDKWIIIEPYRIVLIE